MTLADKIILGLMGVMIPLTVVRLIQTFPLWHVWTNGDSILTGLMCAAAILMWRYSKAHPL